MVIKIKLKQQFAIILKNLTLIKVIICRRDKIYQNIYTRQ